MAELVEMIKDRQENSSQSVEEYANQMGLRSATLYRLYNTQRSLGIRSLQKMATFYRQQGDNEMVNALADYALGNGGQSPS